jgi:hypothetical protein
LLVADQTAAEAREILAERGVGFIEGLQNAHIELPGLPFHIEGRRTEKPARGAAPPTRLRGKAGVAAQALLLQPAREWSVNELAAEAGIAAALAHRVLTRLEREGLVKAEGSGPQRFRTRTNPTALLDLWAEEQADRQRRTAGHLLAQTPQQLVERLGAWLQHAGIDYAVTGAAGANPVAA